MSETEKKAEKTLFEQLNSVDVSDKTEKKNGLTYLSWAWAWGELKKRCPNAAYKVYENPAGWNYFTDGHTCWCKVSVTVDGLEYIEYLPIMNPHNLSIPLASVTSMDVTKTIQRAVTKAIARHGLGLYIYSGEDVPEDADKYDEEQEAVAEGSVPKLSQETVDLLGSYGITPVKYSEMALRLTDGKSTTMDEEIAKKICEKMSKLLDSDLKMALPKEFASAFSAERLGDLDPEGLGRIIESDCDAEVKKAAKRVKAWKANNPEAAVKAAASARPKEGNAAAPAAEDVPTKGKDSAKGLQ
jgi:hypothetical protein